MAGFTLFELVIVIVIIAVLAAVFLDRVQANLEAAERMAMETQARAISSALQLQMAAMITRGRGHELGSLTRTNPMDWLVAKPPNFLGELSAEPKGEEALGNWYYDQDARQLVYLVRRGESFTADAQGRKQVRYAVVAIYDESDRSRNYVAGMLFQPVEPYRWR